ncbi:hypothetical protein FWK35_00032260 [Aphis craccivora]|uniref:Uncharacterized protein n=1 Tax=Aphis craccivora TaxID=307492 RepID=A0A6G0X4C2_APHCR|nr:hypothetical protein FWK35_00032260 [Aphis craccivora]
MVQTLMIWKMPKKKLIKFLVIINSNGKRLNKIFLHYKLMLLDLRVK